MTTESLPLSENRPRSRRGIAAVAVLVLAAVLGGLWWMSRPKAASVSGAGPGPAGRAAEARPVSVVLAPVTRRDVPVFLEGLGTVTPDKTVVVRSRVDGQLQSVAFKEGQAVKKGDLLAQIDPRPFRIQLHTAQAALARNQAQLRGGRLNLERYASVRKEKLIAQQQVDDQQTVVDQLEAQVRADQAQVESARLQLDYARITSPIDGVTGVRQIDPGNFIKVNDANGLVIVTQLDPIAVMFTLPQDDLAAVSEHMARGPLAVAALSRDGLKELARGEVTLIDNQINAATATIRLKAIFPNPSRVLWPNQFVKARLHLTTRQGALTVPAVAVQRGPRGSFAYVVGADQKAAMRPIEIAGMEGELAIVAKGLEEGESVVVDGQSQLRPGASVATKKPEGQAREGGPRPAGQRQGGSTP